MSRPHAFPVSVKGICVRDGQVLLLRNERDEWELPGGKLELDEDPVACVKREIAEETGWTVTVDAILDAWQYHIRDGVEVLIVTYGCFVDAGPQVRVSREHQDARLFDHVEVGALWLPSGYRRSIDDWYAKLNTSIRG
jgi:8-oxo-dGTP pyrophosphatase MutT (NUDIX family)